MKRKTLNVFLYITIIILLVVFGVAGSCVLPNQPPSNQPPQNQSPNDFTVGETYISWSVQRGASYSNVYISRPNVADFVFVATVNAFTIDMCPPDTSLVNAIEYHRLDLEIGDNTIRISTFSDRWSLQGRGVITYPLKCRYFGG